LPEAPDLAGFAEAQSRLRTHFGEPVLFIWPAEKTWPPGTKLDDETGEPYDPMIEPVSTDPDERLALGDVARRPFQHEDVEFSAPGMVEREHVMVAMDGGYASAASAADSFIVGGSEYELPSGRFDGIGELQRYLAFGRRK